MLVPGFTVEVVACLLLLIKARSGKQREYSTAKIRMKMDETIDLMFGRLASIDLAMSSAAINRRRSGGHSAVDSKTDLISIGAASDNSGGSPITTTFTDESGFCSKRTKLEKILLFVVAITTAVLIALIVVTALNDGNGSGKRSICDTPGCIQAAGQILNNMNPTVDPCDDFYEYVCGGFNQRTRIPDDRNGISQFSLIGDDLDNQLRDILEMDAGQTKNFSTVFRLAQKHYNACMDLDTLEKLGLKPLEDMLAKFGGWPVLLGDKWNEKDFDWKELIYTFRANGYSTDYLFDFSIGVDIKNSSYRTIYIDQGKLGMSREYLIQKPESEQVKHYYTFMQKVAVLLGADEDEARKELRKSLDFEISLAKASLPREERRNATRLYHPTTLNDLGRNEGKGLISDWTEYVNRVLTKEVVQVDGDERVVVSTPGYLRNLTQLLAREDKRNVANYLMWRVTRASLGFLNKAARRTIQEYQMKLSGKTETTPRWKTCVGTGAGSFMAAVGQVFVYKHFDHEAKHRMNEMVSDIKTEFRAILKEVAWMDEKTRERALKKLSSIKEYIGYPEELLNNTKLEDIYQGLEISNETYFGNGINMSVWSTAYHWKKLREKVNKTEWTRHSNPAVVNAYYSAIENSIQFPAGILQGLFFDKNRPAYLNYGGIGWVIGHEITHGFDDEGRQYDEQGNLHNWWEPSTVNEFLNKTQCIIEQYGSYRIDSLNVSLNGINTQGENIADNGGIKQAFRAYSRWVSRHGKEASLPGLQLTPEQLFWVGAGNVWCAKTRPKALEQSVRTGAHAPGQFRVLGPFSNSEDFAEAFSCPRGSTMNPIKKCNVW